MMKKWLIVLLLSGVLCAEEGTKKAVYDVTTGNLGNFENRVLKGIVHNKDYYQGNFVKLDVALVIHGNAYKFFVKDLARSPYRDDANLTHAQPELAQRIAAMAKYYDVEFLICEAGMNGNKIDRSVLYEFVKLIPNATVGLIDKQNDGYAYIPVH